MADDRDLRLHAGHTLGRSLGDPAVRRMFADNGYKSGQEIVVVLESDTIEEVFDRVRQYPPPVVVAIYWPDSGKFTYMTFTSGGWASDATDGGDIGGGATIGMLNSSRPSGETSRFSISKQTVEFERYDAMPA